jgi:hypothetical protein
MRSNSRETFSPVISVVSKKKKKGKHTGGKRLVASRAPAAIAAVAAIAVLIHRGTVGDVELDVGGDGVWSRRSSFHTRSLTVTNHRFFLEKYKKKTYHVLRFKPLPLSPSPALVVCVIIVAVVSYARHFTQWHNTDVTNAMLLVTKEHIM